MSQKCAWFGFRSPFGEVAYLWDGHCCRRVRLGADGCYPPRDDAVSRWLAAFFSGDDAPLPPLDEPVTPFQGRLRAALLRLPRGATVTYGALARQLGSSPRAVGRALGANPLPLLVPCHRVVAQHGLGGFSCGVAWKRHLLALEAAR